jgi:A/G-specific adenine glycosylase
VEGVRRQAGVEIKPGPRLLTLRHTVTRFRITLDCFEAEYLSGPDSRCDSIRWLKPRELDAYPLSGTGRKIAQRMTKSGVVQIGSNQGSNIRQAVRPSSAP